MNAPQSAPGKGMTPATKGILLMVLAMFFISVMGVATKTAGISHPIMQVVFVRNFFVLALVLVMVWRQGGMASLKVNDRKGGDFAPSSNSGQQPSFQPRSSCSRWRMQKRSSSPRH